MRDRKDSNTKAQVSQDSGFPAVVGNCQILCDQTLKHKRRKIYTCLQRAHITLEQSRFKISMCSDILRIIVRIGPILDMKTTNFGRITFYCCLDTIEKRISNIVPNTPLRHSIWSNSLLKEVRTAYLAKVPRPK